MEDKVVLVVEDENRAETGRSISKKWGIPIAECPEVGFYLLLNDERIELRKAGDKSSGPVYVDFVGGTVGHRRRFGGGRGQTIAKAVGLSRGNQPKVLDATAGLGRDAFVLASLGCQVTLVERSAVVCALLDDGLRRAMAELEVASIATRMRLMHSNAIELMGEYTEENRPDVIYLDPMFPARRKSASVKKEMQYLQQLLGEEDVDNRPLLEAALRCAGKRVVVKRPANAECLAGREPTMAIKGKKHRYDVYVIKALST